MKEAADRVRTGLITYAARNSNFDGIEIQQGDFLALAEGKMCYTGHDLSKAMKKTLDSINGKEAEFVTLYKGHDATEEQNELVESLLPKLAPSAEINTLDGDQPVYYYMISAE
jgi:dihydroxyacetone kinase-like predicted kinase